MNTSKTPTILQGTETQYRGEYPQYFTDGKELFKIIDSSCTANAREILCRHKGIEYDGNFFNLFKELNPLYKKHSQIILKMGYKI